MSGVASHNMTKKRKGSNTRTLQDDRATTTEGGHKRACSGAARAKTRGKRPDAAERLAVMYPHPVLSFDPGYRTLSRCLLTCTSPVNIGHPYRSKLSIKAWESLDVLAEAKKLGGVSEARTAQNGRPRVAEIRECIVAMLLDRLAKDAAAVRPDFIRAVVVEQQGGQVWSRDMIVVMHVISATCQAFFRLRLDARPDDVSLPRIYAMSGSTKLKLAPKDRSLHQKAEEVVGMSFEEAQTIDERERDTQQENETGVDEAETAVLPDGDTSPPDEDGSYFPAADLSVSNATDAKPKMSERQRKALYKLRKQLSVEVCAQFMTKCSTLRMHRHTIADAKKRDDLSDAFLMAASHLFGVLDSVTYKRLWDIS
jgi:hypothetical protein